MFVLSGGRRMRVRATALATAGIVAAGVLAACGGGGSGASAPQTPSANPASGNSSQQAGSGSTKPIVVPYLAATSGKAASYKAIMSVSLELAKKDFGGDLTIGGRPIQITQIDTGEDPIKAVAAFQRVSGNASVVMGPEFADEFQAVAPLAAQAKIPIISGISTITDTAAKNRPWAFMTNPALGPVASEPTKLWVNKEHLKKITMIIDDSQAAVKLQGDLTAEAAKAAGAAVDTVTIQSGQTSYDTVAQRVAGSAPDGIIISAFPNDAVNIVQALRTQRVNAPIIVVSGTFTPQFVENLGSQADGIYVWTAFWPGNPAGTTPTFAKAFKQAAGAPANANAAFNYEAWEMLFAALKDAKAKLADSTGPNQDRSIIDDALNAVKVTGLDGTPISFNDQGFVPRKGMLLEITAGSKIVKVG